MTLSLRHSLAALTIATLLGLPALAAAAPPTSPHLPDATIQQIIQNRLLKRGLDHDVQVAVENGNVTLTGTVGSLAARDEAERLASGVDDVQTVDSQLTVAESTASNDATARAVSQAIRNSVYFGIFDWIDGTVADGVVTLDGSVRDAWKKDAFADLVKRVPGVTKVENDIEILPVSIADDQMRGVLARRIYGDFSLSQYGIGSVPSIHIIVDNGHITLRGLVATEADKMLAGDIARNSVLSFGVQNDLEVHRGSRTS